MCVQEAYYFSPFVLLQPVWCLYIQVLVSAVEHSGLPDTPLQCMHTANNRNSYKYILNSACIIIIHYEWCVSVANHMLKSVL